ncbi:ABC transporter permease [Fodinicurvata fenggangensis]|uniref:ABC transporter permease n=1 Tax=Fodinicurvata fenggangensis TaxID=1121830 RepID=UPI00047B3905|nr:ABC transporter permease [Fodinicurvata fenggangensis]
MLSSSYRVLVQAGIVLILLGLWEAAVFSGLADTRTLPPPSEIAIHIVALLGDQDVLYNLWITSAQVGLAFLIVAPVGVAIGLLLGEHEYIGRAFRPFFYFLAGVPKSVFLPVFILTFGIGFTQKVAFGIFQAIFVLVISAIAAVGSVSPTLIKVARSYGANRWQLYSQIFLPAMMPVVIEGMRLGMIFNITGVVFAEMYVARAGIGHMIATWGMSFQMPQLFAGIFLTAFLSIAVNEVLRWYERRVDKWRK